MWHWFAWDWKPTAQAINDLPAPVKHYVHELETRCDPALEKRELALLRDEVRMFQAAFHVLRRKPPC